MKSIIQLIQNKTSFTDKAIAGLLNRNEILHMLLISTLLIAIFGFTVGLRHSGMQSFSSFIKLPLLFLITGLICLPTLFILQAFIGIQLNLKQLISLLVVCMSICSILLLSFIPIIVFFLISGTPYELFKFINVAMLGFSGFASFHVFKKTLLQKAQLAENSKTVFRSKMIINAWVLLYGSIGANLGFLLSPLFGDERIDFIWFTSSHENFFNHILHALFG